MSVHTAADEAMDRMVEHIQQAHREFLKATHPDTWGSADFRKDHIAALRRAMADLLELIE